LAGRDAALWRGLRLLEALRLRIKDMDVERGRSPFARGKETRSRVRTMPRAVVHPLQEHLQQVAAIHQQDAADGYGRVELPYALVNDPETGAFLAPARYNPPTCYPNRGIDATGRIHRCEYGAHPR
jgi:integrase